MTNKIIFGPSSMDKNTPMYKTPPVKASEVLPDWYKDRLCSIYEEHIQWIETRMDQYLQSGWDPIGIYGTNDIPGYRQIEGLQTIIDYIQEDAYSSEEKKELLDSFWKELNEWKTISPENDWVVKLPHLKQFFDKYELYN